jgi:hypothetical protein
MNRLTDKLPHKKSTATKMFQCWVDEALLKRVMTQRRQDKVSWRDLIEACFKQYLAERGTK